MKKKLTVWIWLLYALVFLALPFTAFLHAQNNPIADLVIQDNAGTALTGIPLMNGTSPVTVLTIGTNLTLTGGTLNATGTGAVANPTASVGLTAVNGTATSAIRSDGAPALSQAITPTWTGQHTFTNALNTFGVAGTGNSVYQINIIGQSGSLGGGYLQITNNTTGTARFGTGGQLSLGVTNSPAATDAMWVNQTTTGKSWHINNGIGTFSTSPSGNQSWVPLLGTPSSSLAGFNPGSLAGDPSTLSNGDIWYNSSSGALNARIAGATVALGSGGGGSGTVTSVSSGNLSPLFTTTVGTATTTPAISYSLSTAAAHTILGNATGSTAAPAYNTMSAALDDAISSTQGTIMYRNASGWVGLAPGTATNVLTTGGAGANPSWAAAAGGGNVSTSGTITSGQTPQWNSSTTLVSVANTGTGSYVLAASPTLTGVPLAPTATVGTNTTQLATTAFVLANAGSGTVANPTATIGLAAVNGTATSAIRSDGAPALSQAITPTWTGAHIFSGASGVPLKVNGNSGAVAAQIIGSSSSGNSEGLDINSGTTSGDFALLVTNQAGTTTFMEIFGNGAATMASTTATSLTLGQTSSSNANPALVVKGSTFTGASDGALFNAGSTSGDYNIDCVAAGAPTTHYFTIRGDGRVAVGTTVAGSTGAQTINKPSGSVQFAAAATSLVVTDSLVTASSQVWCMLNTNDATAVLGSAVPGAGSFTINMKTAPTGTTVVAFLVMN